MKSSFEIKIPSKSAQNSWSSMSPNVSDHMENLRREMDAFIDEEQSNWAPLMEKFAGKNVRITIETI